MTLSYEPNYALPSMAEMGALKVRIAELEAKIAALTAAGDKLAEVTGHDELCRHWEFRPAYPVTAAIPKRSRAGRRLGAMVEVTQADRDAAAEYYLAEGADWFANVVQQAADGSCDEWPIVRAFARHREAERKAIVSFLNLCGGEFANKYADWIEAGEHLK